MNVNSDACSQVTQSVEYVCGSGGMLRNGEEKGDDSLNEYTLHYYHCKITLI